LKGLILIGFINQNGFALCGTLLRRFSQISLKILFQAVIEMFKILISSRSSKLLNVHLGVFLKEFGLRIANMKSFTLTIYVLAGIKRLILSSEVLFTESIK
jgi:hypothetical protein